MLRASPAVRLWLPRLQLAAQVPSPSASVPKPPEFHPDFAAWFFENKNSATMILFSWPVARARKATAVEEGSLESRCQTYRAHRSRPDGPPHGHEPDQGRLCARRLEPHAVA